ncbi:hypothetical protein HTZ77_09540 [Nonomuraea sp. SMC257]|uniref:Uncharacterized protein n=1 Tax=Nonomuraea montanisoli TaxID=2741721 RepID=A0A7Y6M2Y2_9ACTN|nr:hypothetical protein [Nonomuraea montanisoli]NUW31669.1 hypothetical protein [Nonomuraea montanisoli]
MSEESSGAAVLIEVPDLPFEDLPGFGNPRLMRALEQRRARSEEAVAAFNSAV